MSLNYLTLDWNASCNEGRKIKKIQKLLMMGKRRFFTSLILIILFPILNFAQTFERSEIDADLDFPWEITYGPDDYLWITEKTGKVSRVNPDTGDKTVVFTADDYFGGDPSEKASCGRDIGANTFGLALHPDFLNPDNSYIYFIYSYNSGTETAPQTLYKIVRLKWNSDSNSIESNEDLITELANGFDHYGGRMISVAENDKFYLYYSSGDTGANNDACYASPDDNPNLTTQDPYTKVGKIHRIYADGSIPDDNPISGNTFFTRGHRNPQGLAYNYNKGIVYDIEHGHVSDDEINVLESGMNYGWINVKGYHDGNYPDELEFVENYIPHSDIENDELREPLFSWGANVSSSNEFLMWPTVAPSDGIYYGDSAIEEWTNSLLVVTLKNGSTTDQEVFQFKLEEDGKNLVPSTAENPNPKTYFGSDQNLNGRLRDIAISPDGKKIFLITNNWNGNNPLIVYEATTVSRIIETKPDSDFTVDNFPNPFTDEITFQIESEKQGNLTIEISDLLGRKVERIVDRNIDAGSFTFTWSSIAESNLVNRGIYLYTVRIGENTKVGKIMYLMN